jgi:hypothetical protein
MAEMPDTGSGSPERVAFDLLELIIKWDPNVDKQSKEGLLSLYDDCRRTVRGLSRN